MKLSLHSAKSAKEKNREPVTNEGQPDQVCVWVCVCVSGADNLMFLLIVIILSIVFVCSGKGYI